MKKPPLAWVGCKLGGTEPLGFPRAEHHVSQVEGASGMSFACQLCDFARGGLRNGTMSSAHLSVQEKTIPSSFPDVRLFSSSPYVNCVFQAASLVLELRGSKSM